MSVQRLTADDFFTGLLAALVLAGTKTISVRGDRFDRALESAFRRLSSKSSGRLNLRFRIRTHAIHGDSQTVRDSITTAAQRDLVSLDNPEYQDLRLKISVDEAQTILGTVPGGKDLFVDAATAFLAKYPTA